MAGVVVRANEETKLSVILGRAPIQVAGVVVSASRRTEKVTDAPRPSLVSTSGDRKRRRQLVRRRPQASEGRRLHQTGIMPVGINVRGFNTAFNNRVLQLEDGRIVSCLKAVSLGSLTTVRRVDIASIEVLVGPVPRSMVRTLRAASSRSRTKDPRAYRGTTLDVASGSRSFLRPQGRHAGVMGEKFGYKLSARVRERE
jgi:iron complex outermembrane receptor protein